MASSKPPARSIPGIRGSIPSGYLLGRSSLGEGDVELLTLKKMQSAGLAPTTLPGPPTGLAGGDLTGSYPDPTVRGLRGRNVSNVAPADKNVLAWDNAGTAWAPLMLGAVAYTSAYVDLTGAPPAGSYLPTGGTTGQVLTKNSGTNYDVIWAAGGGGGSGSNAASIQDDGTTVYLAISDGDGLLVLDPSGDPIFMPEVFPVSAIPGLVTADGFSIQSIANVLGVKFSGFSATMASNVATLTDSVNFTVKWDTVLADPQGGYNAATGEYTPNKAGTYLCLYTILCYSVTASNFNYGYNTLNKNGVRIGEADVGPLTFVPYASLTITCLAMVPMNGTTDKLQCLVQTRVVGGTAGGIFGGNLSNFIVVRVGA